MFFKFEKFIKGQNIFCFFRLKPLRKFLSFFEGLFFKFTFKVFLNLKFSITHSLIHSFCFLLFGSCVW